YARPEALHDIQIGGSMYRDRLYPQGIGALRQSIYSGYIAYVTPHTEAIAEGVLVEHESPSLHETYRSYASYIQLSRQYGKLRPYFRYDYQNTSSHDPIFGGLGRQSGPSVGVRFDLSDFAALKIQYGRLGFRQLPSVNDFQTQL